MMNIYEESILNFWICGVNGPLHFLEDCILLADQIYPNRHPTVTLISTQQINRKPEHLRDLSIFIRLLGRCVGILGTYFFFLYTPAGQVDFLRFFFSKFLLNWAHTFFSHKQLLCYFLLCSTVQLTGP